MPTAFERMSDQRLDPDYCLPYWLTESAGAPDTWRPDDAPGSDEDGGWDA